MFDCPLKRKVVCCLHWMSSPTCNPNRNWALGLALKGARFLRTIHTNVYGTDMCAPSHLMAVPSPVCPCSPHVTHTLSRYTSIYMYMHMLRNLLPQDTQRTLYLHSTDTDATKTRLQSSGATKFREKIRLVPQYQHLLLLPRRRRRSESGAHYLYANMIEVRLPAQKKGGVLSALDVESH